MAAQMDLELEINPDGFIYKGKFRGGNGTAKEHFIILTEENILVNGRME